TRRHIRWLVCRSQNAHGRVEQYGPTRLANNKGPSRPYLRTCSFDRFIREENLPIGFFFIPEVAWGSLLREGFSAFYEECLNFSAEMWCLSFNQFVQLVVRHSAFVEINSTLSQERSSIDCSFHEVAGNAAVGFLGSNCPIDWVSASTS